ncbi:MAG: hypothetical protein WCE75_06410 [Terracidiphilus sp.]
MNKRWRYILYAGILVVAGWLVYTYREDLGIVGPHGIGASSPTVPDASSAASAHPPRINWQEVDRPKEGFKLEMPSDVKEIQVPAYNESGGTEPVSILYANPDGGTAFSVAWADEPPVVRDNNRQPDRILDMARDGAMARTQTQLVNESRNNLGGNPARDFVARNSGGGVLDSRLIVAGNRLYMLSAVFPSMSARREQDVIRFYNSFTQMKGAGIPQSLPAGPPPATRE